jgi:hypothetical protein
LKTAARQRCEAYYSNDLSIFILPYEAAGRGIAGEG